MAKRRRRTNVLPSLEKMPEKPYGRGRMPKYAYVLRAGHFIKVRLHRTSVIVLEGLR